MRFVGRASAAVFLILASVSCMEEDERPCGGCASPHPYTSYTGGTTSSLTGSAEVAYEHGPLTQHCESNGNCTWSGKTITINATVPNAWTDPDAGVDADVDAEAGADGEADAGADADAGAEAEAEAEADAEADARADVEVPDATTGAPRGWSATGPVVIVDLGGTPLHVSAALVDARIITCPNRHEKLVADGGTYACASATLRPARIQPLEGIFRFDHFLNGESSRTMMHVDGVTPSGSHVVFDQTTSSEPVRSYTDENCY